MPLCDHGTNLDTARCATCEDDRMAARTLRELEVLTIEAARQLRDRILASEVEPPITRRASRSRSLIGS